MKNLVVRSAALLLIGAAVFGIGQVFGLFPSLAALPKARPDETPEAVKALIDALKDKDADVRKNAVVALGRIGLQAKDAIPALTGVLKDESVDVRGAAVLTLGR